QREQERPAPAAPEVRGPQRCRRGGEGEHVQDDVDVRVVHVVVEERHGRGGHVRLPNVPNQLRIVNARGKPTHDGSHERLNEPVRVAARRFPWPGPGPPPGRRAGPPAPRGSPARGSRCWWYRPATSP